MRINDLIEESTVFARCLIHSKQRHQLATACLMCKNSINVARFQVSVEGTNFWFFLVEYMKDEY